MDLNTIDLPPSVIAELYGNALTETYLVSPDPSLLKSTVPEKTMIPVQPEKTGGWRSLGNNAGNVLVMVNNNEFSFLSDHELRFLTGILTACKLSLEDVALVNLHNNPEATGKQLTGFFKSRIVLLFDIEPAALGLPVNFPQYQLQPFAGTTYLYAPSMEQLENDRVEKSKLWVCLKRLFNL